MYVSVFLLPSASLVATYTVYLFLNTHTRRQTRELTINRKLPTCVPPVARHWPEVGITWHQWSIERKGISRRFPICRNRRAASLSRCSSILGPRAWSVPLRYYVSPRSSSHGVLSVSSVSSSISFFISCQLTTTLPNEWRHLVPSLAKSVAYLISSW